jgi:predicted amidohydrolase
MNIAIKRAAVAQLRSTGNKHENLLNIAKCANIAKEHSASMLFLPECCGFIGSTTQETLNNAENLDCGPHAITDQDINSRTPHSSAASDWLKTLESVVDSGASDISNQDMLENSQVSIIRGLQAIAVKSNLWISGTFHEQGAPPNATCTDEGPPPPRVYNTHIIMDSHGQIVSKYRKIHLFDVSIPSQGINLRESASTAAGSKLVVCDSPIGKIGLSTCYDLRFAEMYRALVEKGGADILLVPSAFTVPTGKAHWHTLLRGECFFFFFEMDYIGSHV